jgi:putative addiction module killer protein
LEGREPFQRWFGDLDVHAAAKVTTALKRIAAGSFSEVKPVGSWVLERRIDWGPGYRVYFGRDGSRLVILLAGGTKQRQQQNIAVARARWADFKRRRDS